MEWTYDDRTDTWVTGSPKQGCGVYQLTERSAGQWEGNVVVSDSLVLGIGAYPTKEEAMAEAERVFNERLERLQNENGRQS